MRGKDKGRKIQRKAPTKVLYFITPLNREVLTILVKIDKY